MMDDSFLLTLQRLAQRDAVAGSSHTSHVDHVGLLELRLILVPHFAILES